LRPESWLCGGDLFGSLPPISRVGRVSSASHSREQPRIPHPETHESDPGGYCWKLTPSFRHVFFQTPLRRVPSEPPPLNHSEAAADSFSQVLRTSRMSFFRRLLLKRPKFAGDDPRPLKTFPRLACSRPACSFQLGRGNPFFFSATKHRNGADRRPMRIRRFALDRTGGFCRVPRTLSCAFSFRLTMLDRSGIRRSIFRSPMHPAQSVDEAESLNCGAFRR